MITRIRVQNFKQFEDVEFSVSQSVVFIGPNNSGKTSLFQALCLWEVGVRKFLEAKKMNKLNKTRGVTLNRQSLINTPIESVKLLWRNQQPINKRSGVTDSHVPLIISISGENNSKEWTCTTSFTYYNEESFTCKITKGESIISGLIETIHTHFGFLQTMSGISSMEDKLTSGSIARYLGEGKTAEVIRNLCYNMLYPDQSALDFSDSDARWAKMVGLMKRMFGVTLRKPVYIKETGIVDLTYSDANGRIFPISSAGRGFQQILLLLTYILSNKNIVLLLDEPDAHLEIVRQREIFSVINQLAAENESQVFIASHSEVVLNSASDAEANVIALIEHHAYPILDKKGVASIRSALSMYGWDKYAAARMYGHILFLEGETDLKMLVALANKLNHPVKDLLPTANVQYVNGNSVTEAIKTYVAFQSFFSELKGLAIFDRLQTKVGNAKLNIISMQKRELENYFAKPKTLISYAESLAMQQNVSKEKISAWMRESIENYTTPARLRNLNDSWWDDVKITDEWLDLIFPDFFAKLPQKSTYKNFKTNYYQLVEFAENIDDEIRDVLDAIHAIL